MLKESSFIVALSLSLLGHASLFVLLPSRFYPSERPAAKVEDVEVTYFKISDVPQWEEPVQEIPGAVLKEDKEDPDLLEEEETLYREIASQLRDPTFLTYYQGIREKIRKSAKRRYQGKPVPGDVSLGFTLFSNGKVKKVNVLRKNPSLLLRTLAVQSLIEASPFPPFPETLRRDELSFAIVLTFNPKAR